MRAKFSWVRVGIVKGHGKRRRYLGSEGKTCMLVETNEHTRVFCALPIFVKVSYNLNMLKFNFYRRSIKSGPKKALVLDYALCSSIM